MAAPAAFVPTSSLRYYNEKPPEQKPRTPIIDPNELMEIAQGFLNTLSNGNNIDRTSLLRISPELSGKIYEAIVHVMGAFKGPYDYFGYGSDAIHGETKSDHKRATDTQIFAAARRAHKHSKELLPISELQNYQLELLSNHYRADGEIAHNEMLDRLHDKIKNQIADALYVNLKLAGRLSAADDKLGIGRALLDRSAESPRITELDIRDAIKAALPFMETQGATLPAHALKA